MGNACVYTQCYYMARPIWTKDGSKRVISRNGVPFGGMNDVSQFLGAKPPTNETLAHE